nr:hypothetical protein [Tanacetum cinerariifolium]
MRNTKDFEAKYNKVKAKVALLSSSASASSSFSSKNKGLIAESHDWDKEEVSSDDEETEVEALMVLTDEERISIGKESARNGKWTKITIKKVHTLLEMEDNDDRKSFLDYLCIDLNFVEEQRNNLSSKHRNLLQELNACKEQLLVLKQAKLDLLTMYNLHNSFEAEDFTLPNHDTDEVPSNKSQRNTTNPSAVVFDSPAPNYDSADESSVCSTPFLPLKKLDDAELGSGPKTVKSILKSKSMFKAKTLKGNGYDKKGTKSKQNRTKPSTKQKTWKCQQSKCMQTHSSSRLVSNPSSNPTPSTNPNPKGRNRRRSKQRIEDFNLEELSPPIVTMADQRTMAQLLQEPTEGYEDAIFVPAITADNFELKHGLLSLVQNKQFFGHDKEDPHAHVRYFNKITSTLKFPNVPKTSIKLMLFLFSLEGAAWIWLEKEPPDRFSLELHQLDTFYKALNWKDQDSLNSAAGGNFLDKMPCECLAIIESKSKVCYSRNKPVVAKVSTNTSTSGISPDVAELKDMVKALLLDKKSQSPAPVKAVEESFVTCGGAHSNSYQALAYQAPAPQTQGVSKEDFSAYVKANDAVMRNMQTQVPLLRARVLFLATQLLAREVVEGEPDAIKDTVNPTKNESTKDVQPQVVKSESLVLTSEPVTSPISEHVIAMVSAPNPNLKTSIPYPSSRNDEKNREKANNQIEKFYLISKDMSFEISFADALILMPKFASTLKSLIRNKEKLSEMARTPLNEHGSAVLLKKLPEKLGDPRKFLIPCDFPGMPECLALVDLGASINLMPFFMWKRLSLPDLTPTCMNLELSDRSIFRPVVEDEPEATKDIVNPTNNGSTEDVQPQVVQSKSPILTSVPITSAISKPVIAPKLPEKLGDPGKFLIPCDFPGMAECLALADLGASINLMPFSVWKRLSLPDLTPTCMTLELADRSISRPVRVAEDVYVKVGSFYFPADFVVIDFNADTRVSLILGRSFLKTERALIDVFEGELTLCVGKEAITLNLDQTLRYSANYSDMTVKRIDVIDMACEEYSQEVLEVDAFLAIEDDPTSLEFHQPYLDPEGDILLLEAFLNDDPSLPPPNQGNYLLKVRDDKLPVIIAKDLSVEEKTALITVLKSHKRAIAWKLSDIKGIDPEFCTHKILMKEDFEPAVQHQRRVNPKIHDVIKQEVIKLHEAGLIYPIFDSPWVSPVHCVPKKGGFTVMGNEDNELIPTRLVTGWHVCID